MLYVDTSVTVSILLLSAILGMFMGSFLNCMAWRLTHDESVLHGRSHCTTCGHVLGVADLIPVVSWLVSHGRCRYCGERVSARYPATELLCGLIYVSIVAVFDVTPLALQYLAFASILLVLSLTDLDDWIIPNACIVAAIVVRVAYLVWLAVSGAEVMSVLVDSLIGAVAMLVLIGGLTLIMDKVLGRPSMGGGDIKLLAVAGLYFGWQQGLFLLIVSCILGLVLAVVMQRAQATPQGDETIPTRAFPFGPAIALGCWVTMLGGSAFLAWYLGFFQFDYTSAINEQLSDLPVTVSK